MDEEGETETDSITHSMTDTLAARLFPLPHCCRAEGRAGHGLGQCFRGDAVEGPHV